jgi:iron complex outermembrane receptor protein
VGSSRVEGHELRLEADGPFGLSLSSNYTHQDATNETPFPEFHGNQIPSLPPDELFAATTLARDRWSLSYELHYRSAVYLDQANLLERSPAYTTHSLTLELRPLTSDVRVVLEARNLSDEQAEDVIGYPLPGRAFYVTLSYAGRFGKP